MTVDTPVRTAASLMANARSSVESVVNAGAR
jgi:hypothetical protein